MLLDLDCAVTSGPCKWLEQLKRCMHICQTRKALDVCTILHVLMVKSNAAPFKRVLWDSHRDRASEKVLSKCALHMSRSVS